MIIRYSHKSKRRAVRVRAKISGTAARPRLTVLRSLKAIYAQLIDDVKGVTLAAARGKNASLVGEEIGKAALGKKIKTVVFDRGAYKYHGQVKALAEATRKAGLKF